MPDETEQLISSLNEVRLKPGERDAIRSNVVAFMRAHPASEYAVMSTWEYVTARFLNVPRMVYVPAFTLVALIAIGTGSASAAMSSLPGDPLYSLKVSLIEPITGAFATSPTARAQWSAELANRRLAEAEELAAQGKLTPNTSAFIASQLENVTQNFNTSVQSLAQSHDDAAALDAQSSLASSFSTHQQVLSTIVSSDDNGAARPLLAALEAHASSTLAARKHTEGAFSDAQPVALSKQKEAKGAVETMQNLNDNAGDGDMSQVIAAGNEKVQQAMKEGDRSLEEGDFSHAVGSFQTAIQSAQTTNATVGALLHFGKRLHWTSSFTQPTTTATSTDQNQSTTSHSDSQNGKDHGGDSSGGSDN